MSKKDKNKLDYSNSLKNLTDKLYDIMEEKDLQSISWEEEENFKLKLSREDSTRVVASKKESDKSAKTFIRSPMDGVFYKSPSPQAEPFVKAGDKVSAGKTVCIIEAMKLMNEVQVERDCHIKNILVKNNSSVKVNQPLFEITSG